MRYHLWSVRGRVLMYRVHELPEARQSRRRWDRDMLSGELWLYSIRAGMLGIGCITPGGLSRLA